MHLLLGPGHPALGVDGPVTVVVGRLRADDIDVTVGVTVGVHVAARADDIDVVVVGLVTVGVHVAARA
ncbi:MAG: hypothetical protein ACR2FV_09985, partial [Ornithinimicrobium sp.]